MNFELRPAMAGEWGPGSCPGEGPVDFDAKTIPALVVANEDDADSRKSAFALLELENSGLRRLVVELLEKNQKLREQMQAHLGPAGGDSQRSAP